MNVQPQRTRPLIGKSRDRKLAFTLTEVLISSAVSMVVIATTLSLFIFNYKIGFVSQERNKINTDIREFTGRLVQDGRQANYFVLYDSIQTSARDKPGDRRLDGTSGDFLLLVETEPTGVALNPTMTRNITGYFRATESSDEGALAPVRRFEISFDPPSSDALESLIPSPSELLEADEVVELSRGLANGRLFYNFRGQSVMVNGQIHHGNDAKRVTETYNFTVSPRG